jgi:hypothetical protein
MTLLLLQKYPPSKFSEQFTTIDELQTLLDRMFAFSSFLLQQINEYRVDDERYRAAKEKYEEMLDYLKKLIWAESRLESMMVEEELKEVRKKHAHKAYLAKRKKEKVEKILEKLNLEDSLQDTALYAGNLTSLKEVEAWVQKVGEWFESGALGEGSVRFGEKVFKFSPSP